MSGGCAVRKVRTERIGLGASAKAGWRPRAAACLALSMAPTIAFAAAEAATSPYAVHGQLTYVEQETNDFASPYRGANSLSPGIGRQTFDLTLFLGARLWAGAEAWLNPELDQGFGLDNTLGVAGFPSGEAYKVGRKVPYLRLQRAFIRQTLNRGSAEEGVEEAANQFADARSTDRVVVTVGKFGVGDVFDTSQYAHDPRGDFLNWSAVDAGSFDYAADAWGYTVGAAAEWYTRAWTLRGGVFELSNVPNSEHLASGGHAFQLVAELERRYELAGRPGRALLTAYDSRARMALLADAIALGAAGYPVDVAAVRKFRSRSGLHLLLEQQLAPDLGLFARLGGASGNVEAYEFTDIDRTVELGASLKGASWRRARDTVGIAAMVNGISSIRHQFLDVGGLGILIGDGQLRHPGAERIVETYYGLAVGDWATMTFDYQHIQNPAYNSDRGPAAVYAIRLHAQF